MNRYKCKDCGVVVVVNSAEKSLSFPHCKAEKSTLEVVGNPGPVGMTIIPRPEAPKPEAPQVEGTKVGPSVLDTPSSGTKVVKK